MVQINPPSKALFPAGKSKTPYETKRPRSGASTAAALLVFIAIFVIGLTSARLTPLFPFAFHVTATGGEWCLARISFGFTPFKLRLDIFPLKVVLESIFFVVDFFLARGRIFDLLLKDAVEHASPGPGGGDDLRRETPKEAGGEDWIVFFDSDGSRGCGGEKSSEGVDDLHGAWY